MRYSLVNAWTGEIITISQSEAYDLMSRKVVNQDHAKDILDGLHAAAVGGRHANARFTLRKHLEIVVQEIPA